MHFCSPAKTPRLTHPLNQNHLAGIRFFDLAGIPAGKNHLAGIYPWRKTHRYSNMTIAIFHLAGILAGKNHLAGIDPWRKTSTFH